MLGKILHHVLDRPNIFKFKPTSVTDPWISKAMTNNLCQKKGGAINPMLENISHHVLDRVYSNSNQLNVM